MSLDNCRTWQRLSKVPSCAVCASPSRVAIETELGSHTALIATEGRYGSARYTGELEACREVRDQVGPDAGAGANVVPLLRTRRVLWVASACTGSVAWGPRWRNARFHVLPR